MDRARVAVVNDAGEFLAAPESRLFAGRGRGAYRSHASDCRAV